MYPRYPPRYSNQSYPRNNVSAPQQWSDGPYFPPNIRPAAEPPAHMYYPTSIRSAGIYEEQFHSPEHMMRPCHPPIPRFEMHHPAHAPHQTQWRHQQGRRHPFEGPIRGHSQVWTWPDRNRSDVPSGRSREENNKQQMKDKREYVHRSKDEDNDEYMEAGYSAEKVQEKLRSLQPAYVQCTQNVQYYARTNDHDSTVTATPLLKELYKRFETELSTRHSKLWKPNKPVDCHEAPHEENQNSGTLPAEHVCTSSISMNMTQPKYEKKQSPEHSGKWSDSNAMGGENEYDAEDYLQRAGELISSIRRLKHNEKRLHNELWYNDPAQANDGPLCRCSPAAKKKGIRHNIYPGEKPLTASSLFHNNIGKLHNYLVTISPPVNFDTSNPTTIVYDGREYVFEGFSILSHQPLEELPFCDLIRFHIRYTIYLIEEPVPENFCLKGLQLFSDYFFRDILELYDWVEADSFSPKDNDSEIFRNFHFFPRFVRPLPDNGKEILSLCEVLKYLLHCNKPLVLHDDLKFLMNCTHRDWLNYTDKVRGMIVTFPGWKPSSLRVDQLDRYDRTSLENPDASKMDAESDDYPLIIHFGIRPANLSYAGDPQYQRVWRSYLKLRHLMANSPTIKESDKAKLKRREEALQEMRRAKVMQREVTVELSSKGFMMTGIFSDMSQHALLLPVLTHHLRYQLCLTTLEKQIGYNFRERKWLSHAMNHPSCQMNFGSNPDHVRNALSNCGLRQPKYGDSSIHYKYTRKRGITTLIRIMARLGQKRPVLSPIEHNERLEFLGDAVVGYLTSIHLYFMFPELSEGALTTFRTAIVNNQHLAQLAERMHLDEFMLYAHGPDLCRSADLRHAMANCFEALMGAIYMEAGLEKAQELFAKFLWSTKDLQNIWLDVPLHPLQKEEPGTDRHYIESVPILQELQKFEKIIGVKFNHIRVLAKAFTWRNVHENILTRGHNQRLEFLGDSICNLVTSTYLFELYPTHHEGHLTLLRATMVNGRTQSLVATELGMPKYVITNMSNVNLGKMGKPRGPDWREKNLADLLEAFVASLYIDKGLEFVKGFMQVCFFPRLKEFIITQQWNDPKSCLQQCCLTLRQEGKEPQLPTYKIENKSGPSHARKYRVTVYFQGSPIGSGQGGSIQEAERNAAKRALEEYNFPQLEWQRRYVAKKHNVPYKPRRNLKRFEEGNSRGRHKSEEPPLKKRKL